LGQRRVLPLAAGKVGKGSTAVPPVSCGNRQQWVGSGPSTSATSLSAAYPQQTFPLNFEGTIYLEEKSKGRLVFGLSHVVPCAVIFCRTRLNAIAISRGEPS
jgi:hypothetical protein